MSEGRIVFPIKAILLRFPYFCHLFSARLRSALLDEDRRCERERVRERERVTRATLGSRLPFFIEGRR